MSDISLVNGVTSGRVEGSGDGADRALKVQPEAPAIRPSDRPSDRVDISDRARLLSQLAALPDTRTDLVSSIRRQIADGTYDTADRLDQAVSSLLGDLDLPN